MDTRHWLIFALGGVCLCAATWLACRWWYRRKLDAAYLRLDKTDKARLFSIQQTLQARKQIEALQKDLTAQQETMAKAQIDYKRTRHLESALRATAEEEARAAALSRPLGHGFAETQPMA